MRSSRLSVRFPATVISLALTLGVVAFVAAPASAGAKWKVAASSKSTGQYSLADVNTEVLNPMKFEVTVTSPALVQWAMDCVKGSKIIMTKGKDALKAAGAVPVKVATSSSKCQLSANAQNYGTGTDTLSIKFSGGSVGE
jgi:hypothetical protein